MSYKHTPIQSTVLIYISLVHNKPFNLPLALGLYKYRFLKPIDLTCFSSTA